MRGRRYSWECLLLVQSVVHEAVDSLRDFCFVVASQEVRKKLCSGGVDVQVDASVLYPRFLCLHWCVILQVHPPYILTSVLYVTNSNPSLTVVPCHTRALVLLLRQRTHTKHTQTECGKKGKPHNCECECENSRPCLAHEVNALLSLIKSPVCRLSWERPLWPDGNSAIGHVTGQSV